MCCEYFAFYTNIGRIYIGCGDTLQRRRRPQPSLLARYIGCGDTLQRRRRPQPSLLARYISCRTLPHSAALLRPLPLFVAFCPIPLLSADHSRTLPLSASIFCSLSNSSAFCRSFLLSAAGSLTFSHPTSAAGSLPHSFVFCRLSLALSSVCASLAAHYLNRCVAPCRNARAEFVLLIQSLLRQQTMFHGRSDVLSLRFPL
jgi:hypothetical protein